MSSLIHSRPLVMNPLPLRWTALNLSVVAAVVLAVAGCGGDVGGNSPVPNIPDAAPPPPPDATLDDDAELDDLDVSLGELTPRFGGDVDSYRVSVSLFVSQIRLTPNARSDAASIEIDGIEVISGQASQPLDLTLGENSFVIDVTAEAGNQQSYTVTIDRTAAVIERSYEKTDIPDGGDEFGASLATAGDYIAVGAPGDSSADPADPIDDTAQEIGAVFALRREGASWMPDGYLKASNPGSRDRFGTSVAMTNDTLVVGAPGESSADGAAPDNNLARDSGAAYVYRRDDTGWQFEAYLKAASPDALDQFGISVAISGDVIAVGAIGESSNSRDTPDNNEALDSGAVYIFERSGLSWAQTDYVKASNLGEGDNFGASVALQDTTLVVSAPGESSADPNDASDNGATGSGAVYVFEQTAGTWSEVQYLKAGSITNGDAFGTGLALHQDTLVIGAPQEDSNNPGNPGDDSLDGSGAAYVFIKSESEWLERAYLKASNLGQGDGFGTIVAVTDGIVAIGAAGEDSTDENIPGADDADGSGAAYVFLGGEASWTEAAFLKTVPAEANDAFATSLALTNGLLVIGAAGEDSSVRVSPYDNEAPESGAAYIFQ